MTDTLDITPFTDTDPDEFLTSPPLRRLGQRLARLGLALAALIILLSAGATPPSPTEVPPPVGIVPIPTYDFRPVEALCADLNAAWDRDWLTVIAALERLDQIGGVCGDKIPREQLYPAYFNYGAWLERRGELAEAILAYQKALDLRPDGKEAALALQRHRALQPPPLTICTEAEIDAALNVVGVWTPAAVGAFPRLEQGRFMINDVPFTVRGVNYYPSNAPWRRFLTEGDLDSIRAELDLIRGAGFNTIRVFLWHDALFQCPGSGAVPKPEGFARLDAVLRMAAERGLRLIVTLNDLPDLVVRPLYLQSDLPNAQALFIVRRYRDEPAILAWDVRNEGDIDASRKYVTLRAVMDWLRAFVPQVRAADPNHLITAGWNESSYLTAGVVDFLSFHHWRSAENMAERIAGMRAATALPILLEEVGYATPGGTEARQVDSLRAALRMAEGQNLLGWLVWTAFDFPRTATCIPPACPSLDNAEHHYGMWRTDYSEKPALRMLKEEFLGR